MGKEEHLKSLADRPIEERREIARQGGIASGKAKREKILMSEIYAEFLANEHEVNMSDGTKQKLTGKKLVSDIMSKVLSRCDSASVSLMKEVRESVEGMNIQLDSNQSIILKHQPVSKIEKADE